jgi:hypothetical protein
MRLFQHQQGACDNPVPGLAETAAALGWQPAPDQPFDRELHDALYDLACDMHGVPGGALGQGLGRNWLWIGFHDAFRFSDAGRTVTVANGRAGLDYEVRHVASPPVRIAVCAVELPAALARGRSSRAGIARCCTCGTRPPGTPRSTSGFWRRCRRWARCG